MPFRFKQFEIRQATSLMKVNTDAVLLGAWANIDKAKTILDIGTGTGIIALMLAQRRLEAKVIGIDVHRASAQEAIFNFRRSPFSERLQGINISLQEYVKNGSMAFDLIVSNPPYYNSHVVNRENDVNKARQEIDLTHKELIDNAIEMMKEEGRLEVVLPTKEGGNIITYAKSKDLFLNRRTNVISRPGTKVNRVLLSFEREKKATKEDDLTIHARSSGISYSSSFKELTSGFYLAH